MGEYMGTWGEPPEEEFAVMNYKTSLLLPLLLSSLILLTLPDRSSTAPVPAPAPAPVPFTPGIKIGALLGAGLVLKAYLLSQVLSGESEEPASSYSSSYGAPAPSYGAPSTGYGAPQSYKPSYNG